MLSGRTSAEVLAWRKICCRLNLLLFLQLLACLWVCPVPLPARLLSQPARQQSALLWLGQLLPPSPLLSLLRQRLLPVLLLRGFLP